MCDVFEEDCHRIFTAVYKYFPVKFRHLGDSKACEPALLVELTHLCVRSALFSFFGRHQECLKVGEENEWHWKCFFNGLALFYIVLRFVGRWVLHFLLGMDGTIRQVSCEQPRLREAIQAVRAY